MATVTLAWAGGELVVRGSGFAPGGTVALTVAVESSRETVTSGPGSLVTSSGRSSQSIGTTLAADAAGDFRHTARMSAPAGARATATATDARGATATATAVAPDAQAG